MFIDDCWPCLAGYYCPFRTCQPSTNITVYESLQFNSLNTSQLTCPVECACNVSVTQASNINGVPCPVGFYCPQGSSEPLSCPGGFTCSMSMTIQPSSCSEGYFCSPGSSQETICDHPFYCPLLSSSPVPCPSGHLARNASTRLDSLRASVQDSCFECQPGYYSDDGQDCYMCLPGYFCPALSSNPFDFPCPRGNYCPAGSAEPTPCGVGTYNRVALASNLSDCLPCPVNTFSSLEGL